MDAEPKPFFSYDREQQYSSLLVPAWVPQSLLQSLLPILHRASHGPADTGPKRVTLRRSCERSDPGLGRGVCIELLQQRDQVGRPVFHVLPFDLKNEYTMKPRLLALSWRVLFMVHWWTICKAAFSRALGFAN